jgi:ribonuclease-3
MCVRRIEVAGVMVAIHGIETSAALYSCRVTDIGYSFRDKNLLAQALTHASVHAEHDNERLEFLGDATLNLLVTEVLYARVPALSEGVMTEIKAAVVSRRTLAESARELELEARATIGKGLQGRALPVSVLANLYEGVLGAIYLDGGLEPAREFVARTLSRAIADAERELGQANPKQRLQHLAQARWATLPSYELVETRGDAHARAFLMRVRLGERVFPSAWGRTRKEAESWAAHEALLLLGDDAAPTGSGRPLDP